MREEGKEKPHEGEVEIVQDSALICLVMLARLHNVVADPAQLAHEFAEDGR